MVFLDPRTGELLALASLASSGPAGTPSALTSPFEPGSTAKPFTAAALLTLGRVDESETVSGENGSWKFVTTGTTTRTITDTHRDPGEFTLARAIQKSSNIAMAKFAFKLRYEEQYEMLRAFGFGAPTGVEFPSERRLAHASPALALRLDRAEMATVTVLGDSGPARRCIRRVATTGCAAPAGQGDRAPGGECSTARDEGAG